MGPHTSCTADAVQATAAFSLICLPLFHSVNDWHRCNPLAASGVIGNSHEGNKTKISNNYVCTYCIFLSASTFFEECDSEHTEQVAQRK